MINAGYKFEVIVPDESVEQSVSRALTPAEFVREASFQKAKSVAELHTDSIVIAADTVAECENKILGKPRDRSHAAEILGLLSGKIHQVLTGTTIWNCQNKQHLTYVESTKLKMELLDDSMLTEYLDSGHWEGKAGAFGYQDGLDWVEILEGLESNVVGLPIELIPAWIRKVGGS